MESPSPPGVVPQADPDVNSATDAAEEAAPASPAPPADTPSVDENEAGTSSDIVSEVVSEGQAAAAESGAISGDGAASVVSSAEPSGSPSTPSSPAPDSILQVPGVVSTPSLRALVDGEESPQNGEATPRTEAAIASASPASVSQIMMLDLDHGEEEEETTASNEEAGSPVPETNEAAEVVAAAQEEEVATASSPTPVAAEVVTASEVAAKPTPQAVQAQPIQAVEDEEGTYKAQLASIGTDDAGIGAPCMYVQNQITMLMSCKESGAELSEFQQFLVEKGLKELVEGLFRRKYQRRDVLRVNAVFQSSIRLCLAFMEDDVPALASLAVLLLGGTEPTPPKPPMASSGVRAGAAARAATVIKGNFYRSHGKPVGRVINRHSCHFWPDERDKAQARGEDVVGRRLSLFCRAVGAKAPGLVIAYDADTNLHWVQYKDYGRFAENLSDPARRPEWVDDVEYEEDPSAVLTYSPEDVGRRIQLNWPAVPSWFFGFITQFDDRPNDNEHYGLCVTYDDGDRRWYPKHRMEAKEYKLYKKAGTTDRDDSIDYPGYDEDVPQASQDYPEDSVFVPPAQPAIEQSWCIRPAPRTYAVSMYLVDIINLFGNAGGFDAILARIHDSSKPVPLNILMILLHLIHGLQRRIERTKYCELVEKVRDGAIARLKSVSTEEVQAVSKDEMKHVVDTLEQLMQRAFGAEGIAAAKLEADRLRLSVALTLLKSSQLEKRVAGLHDIRAAVGVADNIRILTADGRHPPPSMWPPPQWLAQWIVENKLVEELFGPSMHLELVKRSADLLKLLAETGNICRSHLTAVWSCSRGKHEATVRVVYHLMVELVPELTHADRKYLFSHLENFPFDKWNERTLALAYEFTVAALEEDHKARTRDDEDSESGTPTPRAAAAAAAGSAEVIAQYWYGLDLLWKFCQDDTSVGIDVDLVEDCIDKIALMLTKCPGGLGQRQRFLKACVDNLEANQSVPQSLKLMRKIIATYPQTNKSWFSRDRENVWGIIESLKKNGRRLLDLFFTDLQYYHQLMTSKLASVNDRALSDTGEIKLQDASKVHLDGTRYTHMQQVQARLDFLQYVLLNSSLEVSVTDTDHILVLWECFVERALTTESRNLALEWLGNASHPNRKEGYVAFTDDVAKEIYSKMREWLTTSVRELTPIGVKVFMQYFLDENIKCKKVALVKPHKGRDGTEVVDASSAAVEDTTGFTLTIGGTKVSIGGAAPGACRIVRTHQDLQGVAHVWRIALGAADATVGQSAITMLIELYHRISPKMKGKTNAIHTKFVETCLSRVQEASGDDSSRSGSGSGGGSGSGSHSQQAEQTKLDRAIGALRAFLDLFNEEQAAAPPVTVKMVVSTSQGETRWDLRMRESSTVGEMRALAGKKHGQPPERVLLRRRASGRHNTSDETLDDDSKTLVELCIGNNDSILVSRRDTVLQQDKDSDKYLAATTRIGYPSPKHAGLEQDQHDSGDFDFVFCDEDTSSPLPELAPRKADMTLVPQRRQRNEPLVYLASTKKHFDSLFELLKYERSIGATVWEILRLLPTNREKLAELRNLTAGASNKWNRVLDTRSTYTLLYSLQVVDAFLTSDPQQSALGDWCRTFVYNGGVRHLLNALSTSTFDGPGRTQCLALLFKLVQTFLGLDPSYVYVDASGVGTTAGRGENEDVSLNQLRQMVSLNDGRLVTATDFPSVVTGIMRAMMQLRSPSRGAHSRSRSRTGSASQPGQGKAQSKDFSDHLAEHGMHLLVGCVLSQAQALAAFAEFPQLQEWLEYFCLRASPRCRLAVCRGLYRMCEHLPSVLSRSVHPDSDPTLLSVVLVPVETFTAHAQSHGRSGSASSAPAVEGQHRRMHLHDVLLRRLLVCFGSAVRRSSSCGHYFGLLAALVRQTATLGETSSGEGKHEGGGRAQGDATQSAEQARRAALLSSSPMREGHFLHASRDGVDVKADSGRSEAVVVVPAVGVSVQGLFDRCMTALMRHRSAETFHTQQVDYCLVGLLRLMRFLRQCDDEPSASPNAVQLMEFVYHRCLFSTVGRPRAAVKATAVAAEGTAAAPAGEGTTVTATAAVMSPAREPVRAITRSSDTPTRGGSSGSMDGADGAGAGAGVGPSREPEHSVESLGSLCKTQASRAAAFALLLELCRGCHSLALQLLRNVHHLTSETLAERDDYEYDPEAALKKPHDYVGLRNQGATCYMNSFLQQLYAIPTLRNKLLELDDDSEDLSDSLLFQLQVLFGYLRVSQKRFYETKPFCRTFKDYDGTPVSTAEQKDVNEFANMLFDKLENLNPKAGKLIRDQLGGVFANQIISLESEDVSVREEPFNMITVDIAAKSSLTESLESFVQGELLVGDNKYQLADGTKVDAKKRACIKELPKHLLVHLKRFEFDLDTFTKKKVNSYCEIPMKLNMKPYTVEGLAMKEAREAKEAEEAAASHATPSPTVTLTPSVRGAEESKGVAGEAGEAGEAGVEEGKGESKGAGEEEEEEEGEDGMAQATVSGSSSSSGGGGYGGGLGMQELPEHPESYYKYKLMGILAHTGTADSGHYYSFIKEREPRSGEPRWLEYNDTVVRPFSEDRIRRECYGGSIKEKRYSKVRDEYVMVDIPLNNNAYLAIYDRCDVEAAPEVPGLLRQSSDASVQSAEAHTDDEEAAAGEEEAELPHLQLPASGGGVGVGAGSSSSTRQLQLPSSPSMAGAALAPVFITRLSSRVQRRRRAEGWLPPRVMQAVWRENLEFLRDKNVFNRTFFNFIWNVINMTLLRSTSVRALPVPGHAWTAASEAEVAVAAAGAGLGLGAGAGEEAAQYKVSPDAVGDEKATEELSGSSDACSNLLAVQIATRFYIRVLVHAKAREALPKFEARLCALLSCSAEGARWLMESVAYRTDWLKRMLLKCPMPALRKSFCAVILHCIRTLQASEQPRYGTSVPVRPSDVDLPAMYTATRPASPVVMLLDTLLSFLEAGTEPYVHNIAEFVGLLSSIAGLGNPERRALLQREAVSRLAKFYLDGRTNTLVQSIQVALPSYTTVALIIAKLVRSCRTQTEAGSPPEGIGGCVLTLSERSLLQLLTDVHNGVSFRYTIITQDPEAAAQIFTHLSFGNPELAQKICKLVTDAVVGLTHTRVHPAVRAHFKVLQRLLDIKGDPMLLYRIESALETIMSRVTRLIERQEADDETYLFLAIRLLLRLAVRYEPVFTLMVSTRAEWSPWFTMYKTVMKNKQERYNPYYTTTPSIMGSRAPPRTTWLPI